jgi:hypothetical protein
MEVRCDCEKHTYDTRGEAQTAAKGIWDDDKIKMNAYRCPEGNGFHLSTAKKGKSLRDIPHGLDVIIPLLNKKQTKKKK